MTIEKNKILIGKDKPNLVVNSRVITFSLNPKPQSPLSPPLLIAFQRMKVGGWKTVTTATTTATLMMWSVSTTTTLTTTKTSTTWSSSTTTLTTTATTTSMTWSSSTTTLTTTSTTLTTTIKTISRDNLKQQMD